MLIFRIRMHQTRAKISFSVNADYPAIVFKLSPLNIYFDKQQQRRLWELIFPFMHTNGEPEQISLLYKQNKLVDTICGLPNVLNVSGGKLVSC